MTLFAIFIILVFLHSLVSERLEKTIITAPIVFTTAGMAAFIFLPEFRDREHSLDTFLSVAELGLVMLLFADASKTDLNVLKNIRNLPVRLLSAGMLMTIFLGGLCALGVFPGLSIWEAGILGAILAPTDAGLGQIIVNSPRVPMKIRQALNVEAGLNDGLSVPFLLFFISLAEFSSLGPEKSLIRFIIEQLGFGVLFGIGIGLTGGWLMGLSHRRKWMGHSWSQLGVVALALLSAAASEPFGASMFIAAFVAGLSVQVGYKEVGKHSVDFTEEWGQLLNLSVFFIFGFLVARVGGDFKWTHLFYGILSLTVVRMSPVAIALMGTGLSRTSVLFMGWFGPRGLASIVLGLIYLEQTHHTGDASIRLAVMATVMLSIFAHGLSAVPGIELYARKVKSLPKDAPEHET
ncbi:MAG: sodium:proton exchanger [Desulfobacteraceae bacterium]|nr:MAG: sodium:proton exchanger [Desulfobacteraceae bacterium]